MGVRLSRLRALFPSREELRTNRLEFLLCGVSGLLGPLIFPKYDIGDLAWVALVPFFWSIARLRGRALAWATVAFGFVWNYTTLFWLNTLTIFNPFIPAAAVLAALVETGLLLWFAFPASFAMRKLKPWLAPPVVAGLWVGYEFVRHFTDLAFPWNLLGHTQLQATLSPITQIAAVVGVLGVSFCLAIVNAAIAALIARRQNWSQRLAIVIVPLIVVASAWLYGRISLPSPLEGPQLKVAVIQPNVSQLDKWNVYDPATSESDRNTIENAMIRKQFGMMQEVSGQKPQLYILPETAFTTPWFVYDTELQKVLRQTAENLKADVFFGADNREPRDVYMEQVRRGFIEPRPDRPPTTHTLPLLKLTAGADGTTNVAESGEMAVFNAAWLMKPEGLNDAVYNKVQLVPFGECAPLVDMIPFFQEKIMMVGSFQKGMQFTIFKTGELRYGALICFESVFPQLARGLARAGAQAIVVLTNDAWYDPSYLIRHGGFWGTLFKLPVIRSLAASGPYQHFVNSQFRAIETGLPVMRVANTGITAFIGPAGRINEKLGFGERGTMVQTIRGGRSGSQTLYTRFGDWFATLCLFLSIGMVIAQYVSARREARQRANTDY